MELGKPNWKMQIAKYFMKISRLVYCNKEFLREGAVNERVKGHQYYIKPNT